MATTAIPNPASLIEPSNPNPALAVKIKEEPVDYITISDDENNDQTIPMTVIEQEEIDNVLPKLESNLVPKIEPGTEWDFPPFIPKSEIDEIFFKSIIEATPIYTGFTETGSGEITADQRRELVEQIEAMVYSNGKPSTYDNESINIKLSGELEKMHVFQPAPSSLNIIDSEGNHLISRGRPSDSRKAKQNKEQQKAVEKVLLWQSQNQQPGPTQQQTEHQIQGPPHQQQAEHHIQPSRQQLIHQQQQLVYPATTTSQQSLPWQHGRNHALPTIGSNYANIDGVYGTQIGSGLPEFRNDCVDSAVLDISNNTSSGQVQDKGNVDTSYISLTDLERYRTKIPTTKPTLITSSGSDVVPDSTMLIEDHEPVSVSSVLQHGKHQRNIDSLDPPDVKIKRIENGNTNHMTSTVSHMAQVATSRDVPDVFDINTRSDGHVMSFGLTPRRPSNIGQFAGPASTLSQASPVSPDIHITSPAIAPDSELAELESFSTFTDVNSGTIYHVMVELYAEFKFLGQTDEANQLLQMLRTFSKVPAIYTRINDIKKNWETAVFLAVKKQCPELVSVLVDEEADVNIKAKFRVNYQTGTEAPLHYAAKLGEKGVDILESLLEAPNADVNIYNSEGETPLHLALKEHNLMVRGEVVKSYKTVSLLLKHDADWVLQEYKSGKTALMLAIETKDMDMIRCMLNGNDDRNHDYALNKVRDRCQNTCMHVAGALQGVDQKQHVTLVFMLLKHGGDADAESNDRIVAKMLSPDIFRAAFDRMKGNTPCRLPSKVRSSSSDSVS